MEITNYLNATKEKIISKKYNPWIGVSLGNKYFTYQHLKDYINSCLMISKSRVLVIIADDPHAINYEVFENKNPNSALVKARRKGEEIFNTTSEIIKELPGKEQEKITLIQWEAIAESTWYQKRLKILNDIFRANEDFKEQLVQIVQMNMGDRLDRLEPAQVEKLATYVLQELPIFIGALVHDGEAYDLHLYPGFTLLDDFIINIQEGSLFPEIKERIPIKQELSIIEAYAD